MNSATTKHIGMKSKVIGVNWVPLLNTADSGFVSIQSIKYEATQHCKQQYFKVPPPQIQHAKTYYTIMWNTSHVLWIRRP